MKQGLSDESMQATSAGMNSGVRPNENYYDLIVVGGGAAGFFGAMRVAELRPESKIAVLDAGAQVLSKVKISGGGRCNVTHHLFDPAEFSKRYPRGSKELLGVFHRFQARDTVRWFNERGIQLHTEQDGRMFPESNDSSTIIHCFLDECRKKNIKIITRCQVETVDKDEQVFHLKTSSHGVLRASHVLWATGGQRGGWEILKTFGHRIVEPVPSLFTFKLEPHVFSGLEGLSLPDAAVEVVFSDSTKLVEFGPVLVTHWGVSGPGVLRASAWGARKFAESNYQAKIFLKVDRSKTKSDWDVGFSKRRKDSPRKQVGLDHPTKIPARLWEFFVKQANLERDRTWAELRKEESERLANVLDGFLLQMTARGSFKDEFVTAGGVSLKEIDFKTMQSRKVEGLFMAGEVLDIDGITGGFNFQNAWSTSWIAGTAIADRL